MLLAENVAVEFAVVTVIVAFLGVFLIAFMNGGFGGGFPIVGIPLLSFVMGPVVTAAKLFWDGIWGCLT
ncbi:putative membrane protein YfcA [Rhizobium leguminosarum]